MTTVAQNRWIELITIEQAVETVGSSIETIGGWRSCRESSCVTDADGGALVRTLSGYVSSTYDSADFERPPLAIGSLVGMWAGAYGWFDLFTLPLDALFGLSIEERDGLFDIPVRLGVDDSTSDSVSTPFKIGASYAALIPDNATKLVLAFQDQQQWNNNYGSQNVEVIFDGVGPSNFVVYATQCLYFYLSPTGQLGPAPYYEDIDRGTAEGPHRPATIDIPAGASVVTVTASNPISQAEVGNNYSYLKLQRYLFDPAKFGSLAPRQMLWRRGYNIENYNSFLLEGDELNDVPSTYDCIACGILGSSLRGPTVVAIKTDVRAPLTRIMNRINKTQILPQRVM